MQRFSKEWQKEYKSNATAHLAFAGLCGKATTGLVPGPLPW